MTKPVFRSEQLFLQDCFPVRYAEAGAKVPEHSHDYAQWGTVVEGQMELVIGGKTRNCKKGDEYVIPARAKHYARFLAKSRVIDLFSERTRYRTKPPT